MAILTAKQVTKRFGGVIAVSEFDMEIREYSISSLIGPNGAGKTTFFNCITGFYRPEEGEISFDAAVERRPKSGAGGGGARGRDERRARACRANLPCFTLHKKL